MLPEVRAHLTWMAQCGRAATTIYDRERLLARLDAWLTVYGSAERVSIPQTPITGHSASAHLLGHTAPDSVPAPGAPDASIGLLAATPEALAAWRATLDHAPGVICGYVSHVTCFFGWAVAEGLIPSNPAAKLTVPKRPRRLPRPIATADLLAALQTAPRRIRPWMVLAGWAGFRAKEVALLRAECLYWTGTPAVLIASDATKGIHERIIPLCDFAVAELRAYGPPLRGWVFGREDGQPGPNTPHTVSQLVNEHLRGCGTGATMHQLRHWFLTMVGEETLDIRVVQELAGHRSPETTAGYMLLNNQRAAAGVNALPVPVPGRLRLVEDTGT